MGKTLSVSIVTYKTSEQDLRTVLDSLLSSSLQADIFISDNSPTDELRTFFEGFPVTYIFNNGNLGYGKGHNVIINNKIQSYKYHLVLNADVYFDRDVLQALCDFMDLHPQYAHLMPMVRYPDKSIQQLCRKNPTYKSILLKRPLLARLAGSLNITPDDYETAYDYEQPHENIPFLSGCFMLMRTDALRSIGGFDEDIFLYFEDADITRRLLKHYKNLYYPSVCVYHQYKRGTGSSLKHMILAFQGLSTYLSKHRKR